MSIESVAYVLNLPMKDARRKLVLIGYANHAHRDGTGAWPSVQTVADYAVCSTRSAQRDIRALVAEGYLREGDQGTVASNVAKNRRPIVYDVAMSGEDREGWAADRGDHTVSPQTPEDRGDSIVSPQEDPRGDATLSPQETTRGDRSGTLGVTESAVRGDRALSPKPKTNHHVNPDDSLRSSSVATPTDRARRLPADFVVSDRMKDWFRTNGLVGTVDPVTQTEQFKDHHASRGSRMVDWERAWYTWMRNAGRYSAGRAPVRPANLHIAGDEGTAARIAAFGG